jgi:hypothetical protein
MGIALGSVLIARFLDLGTNVQDPLYFDSPTSSRFTWDNGTTTQTMDLISTPINQTHSFCNISLNGQPSAWFLVNQSGQYIDPTTNQPTNNHTIFWVHIIATGSVGSETSDQVGKNYSIFDPIGLLGAPNTEYVLTITAKYVYWAEEAGLHGAQFSLKFDVRTLGGVKIAEGEMDKTCGMLFILKISNGDFQTVELIDTNYDISRNRLTAWPIAIGLAIGAPIVAFCFLHFRKKWELKDNLTVTLLIALGLVTFIFDFMVDIWMYAPLRLAGNLIAHILIAAGFAAYVIWKKLGFKWVIPAILEILFVGVITAATGDAYVPHLTAFMGLTISWLCILWASGYERPESTTKLGKIFSEFI